MLMKKTVLDCLKTQQKQELIATFRAMFAEEKVTFWAEINAENERKIDEGECKDGNEGSV